MGRSIGGGVVGFLAYYIGIGIIVTILAFVLAADGIRDPGTLEPTMAWLLVTSIAGAAMAFLGAAIARAIAKQKMGTFIFAGLVVLLVVYTITSKDPEAMGKLPPETPAVFKAMIEAQINSPMWANVLGAVLTLLGIALGGLNKSDFDKPSEAKPGSWSEPPKPV